MCEQAIESVYYGGSGRMLAFIRQNLCRFNIFLSYKNENIVLGEKEN